MFWAIHPRGGGSICLLHDLEQWFSNSTVHWIHSKGLLKHSLSNSGSLRRHLRIWISNKFPGAVMLLVWPPCFRTVLLKPSSAYKSHFWNADPDSAGLKQELKFCISKKVQEMLRWRNTFWGATVCFRRWSYAGSTLVSQFLKGKAVKSDLLIKQT